jgi:DNA-binding MarR family transcriptional regulator
MTLEEQLKQKEFKTKRQRAYLNVVYTASVLNLDQTRLFKPFGLSLQQYNVLRILRGQNGTPVSIGLIQERMLDIQSNASRLIDKLEDKKLAIRKVCPNDKRQMEITITNEGLKVLLELDEVIVLNESNIQLTDGEADMLNDLLNKLRENQKSK